MARTISVAKPQQHEHAWGTYVEIKDRYRPMIAALEALAAKTPAVYRARVFRRALLGYLYIALVVATILGVIAAVAGYMIFGHHFAALALKPLIFLVIALGYILQSLRVKTPQPDGIRISEGDAPPLFAMLADVRRQTRGPKVDAVYVTADFNASIRQQAVMFGHRNIVSVGLPLLIALPQDEVAAVIAHEFGHLASSHGKMAAWVYRVRMTWLQLSQSLGTGFVGHIFRDFFVWYGPWFSAYSFVLARSNEYEADAVSAAVAGPVTVARALTRVAVEARRYSDFWQALFARSGDSERAYPYAELAAQFVQPGANAPGGPTLKAALEEETDIHDTHPSLSDRLKALDQVAPDLPSVVETGAVILLGQELVSRITETFDGDWWRHAAGAWAQHRETAANERQRLQDLTAKAAVGTLGDEEEWDYIHLLEGQGLAGQALGVAQARAARREDPASRFTVGRLQLEAGDSAGLATMEQVVALPQTAASLRLYALDRCVTFLREAEDTRLDAYQRRLDEALRRHQAIQTEIEEIREDDVFEDACLSEDTIAAIRTRAARVGGIRTIWVARKRLKSAPDMTQAIMFYDAGNPPADGSQGFTDDVLEILGAEGPVLVVVSGPGTTWLQGRLEAVAGSRLLKR